MPRGLTGAGLTGIRLQPPTRDPAAVGRRPGAGIVETAERFLGGPGGVGVGFTR